MSTDSIKSSMKQKFQEAHRKMEEAKKQLREEGKVLFREMCEEIFKKHDHVKAISWRQYTPYFNDGDACTFSVHEAYFYGQPSDDDEDGDYDDYDMLDGCEPLNTSGYGKGPKDPAADDCDEFSSFIESNDDLLKTMFGDHCQVVVTREGVDVRDYDHD